MYLYALCISYIEVYIRKNEKKSLELSISGQPISSNKLESLKYNIVSGTY